MMIDHKAIRFDIRLDDLYLHSRSQLYEKSKTLVSIFSELCNVITYGSVATEQCGKGNAIAQSARTLRDDKVVPLGKLEGQYMTIGLHYCRKDST